MWTLFFTDAPVTDYETAKASDTAKFARFFWGMMDRGVYLPCSQFEAAFVSAAHTEADIDRTVAAAREALAALISRRHDSSFRETMKQPTPSPPQTTSRSPAGRARPAPAPGH